MKVLNVNSRRNFFVDNIPCVCNIRVGLMIQSAVLILNPATESGIHTSLVVVH